MRSQHRLPLAAAGLVVALAVVAGCGASEDETGTTPARAGLGGAAGLPQPDNAAKLDPATKTKCDAVWSLGVFVYASHITPNPPPAEREKLHNGINNFEPKAIAQVPELTAEFKLLAAHAHEAMDSKTAIALNPAQGAANNKLTAYLRTTCKYKPS
jgi:hypothetical protein